MDENVRAEVRHLHDVIHDQRDQIEALVAEIALLRGNTGFESSTMQGEERTSAKDTVAQQSISLTERVRQLEEELQAEREVRHVLEQAGFAQGTATGSSGVCLNSVV